jgi:rare lipoprotein A (peptidoglycan hydrolase)
MVLRLATLAGIGLFGAAQAAAQQLPALPIAALTHSTYSAVGLASWYGGEFHGHATANGEVFDMRSLSAAHRTMPLPSYARVTNLSNSRSVIVRVNDRGPFVKGRMLDVSSRVANLLEFNHFGLTKVRLDYVGKAAPAGSDGPALLASLQTRGAPVAAEPPPVAGPTPADEGQTIIARVVDHPKPAEPRSPFGELIAYPFLIQASQP